MDCEFLILAGRFAARVRNSRYFVGRAYEHDCGSGLSALTLAQTNECASRMRRFSNDEGCFAGQSLQGMM
jgi:hypothetical protein